MTWTAFVSLIAGRRRRARASARAAADDAQDAERRAARQRILDLARRNEGPGWNARTMPLPAVERPLMTRAQRFRGHGGSR